MSGVDDGPGRQSVEDIANREDDLCRIATGQVGTPDSPLEERVAGKTIEAEEKADRALRVARRMQNPDLQVLERHGHPVLERLIDAEAAESLGQKGILGKLGPV